MADVTVKYKGNTIAEISKEGTKTLKTSGKYCEGDISVSYIPPSGGEVVEATCKTYELNLAKKSGWVELTALDSEVLAHINDPSLVVTLSCLDSYEYVYYSVGMAVASNTHIAMQGSYPVYGLIQKQSGETSNNFGAIYYPPNKTDTSTTLGSGMFRLDGSKYYFKPWDGYVRAGNYRLTFTW